MDSLLSRSTGGASIIPSARKSIHDHISCPFRSTSPTMVRYGLTVNEDIGTDEVDNVFSKHASPIQRNNRRGSMSIDNEQKQLTDESSSVLSKSLPTTLPSYLNYSDDSEYMSERNGLSDNSYLSASYGTPSRINHSTDNVSNYSNYNTGNVKQSSKFKYIWPLVSVIVLIISLYISLLNNKINEPNNLYDEYKFYNDINNLGSKYNVDFNSLLQVQTGISTIYKRQDTGSFIFVYNSNAKHFNTNDFNKFINDVSFAASKYLRNDSAPVQYTMVEGTDLNMDEHSELINKFREDLDKTGVMLVKHVEAIPSTLAMAFHYYCDEYNPLVKKSAVFFTLNLAKCSYNPDNKSLHTTIEKCLMNKWNAVPSDSIGPLLTRVVSVVVDVTSVF